MKNIGKYLTCSVLLILMSCDSDSSLNIHKIDGTMLKGEWVQITGDNSISVFDFSGYAKVIKKITKPKWALDTYRIGIYDIEDNNLVVYLEEPAINSYESVRMHEWEVCDYDSLHMVVRENGLKQNIFKIYKEISLDLQGTTEYSFDYLFDDEIDSVISYDSSIVKVDETNSKFIAVSYGRTYVNITLKNSLSFVFVVSVQSDGIDGIDYFHKSLGCRERLLTSIFGKPNSIMDNICHLYRENDCEIFLYLDEFYGDMSVSMVMINLSNKYSPESVMNYLNQTYYNVKSSDDNYIQCLNKNATIYVGYNKEEHRLYYSM